MVSALRVVLRIAHVVGAMLFLALQVNTILRSDEASSSSNNNNNLITISPLPALGLTAPFSFNGVLVAEIVSTIVLLAGGANAALLKPRVNMANTPSQSKKWRLMVYLGKLSLFLLCTPLAKTIVKASGMVPATAADASATNALEIDRTAAVIRASAAIAASVLGAYARYYREEATALSAKVGAAAGGDKKKQ